MLSGGAPPQPNLHPTESMLPRSTARPKSHTTDGEHATDWMRDPINTYIVHELPSQPLTSTYIPIEYQLQESYQSNTQQEWLMLMPRLR